MTARFNAVPEFVVVTTTPGSNAPVWSVTVPEIVPVCAIASAQVERVKRIEKLICFNLIN